MSKKIFSTPRVLLSSGWGGDGGDTGGGSVGSSPDATLCTFQEWLEMYRVDTDGDGVFDEYDFATWWDDNGFTIEDWERYNPDIPWPFV